MEQMVVWRNILTLSKLKITFYKFFNKAVTGQEQKLCLFLSLEFGFS
jgi:hypothetical protein